MNPALLELLFSAVLLLELPGLVSVVVLGSSAMRLEPRPKRRWVLLAMAASLSIPWAGAVLGVLLGVLLALVFGDVWIPLLAGLVIGVLYLQLRWTQLILAEWRELVSPSSIPAVQEAENEKS